MTMLHRILLSCVLVPLVMSGPTIYKLDQEEKTAERVMVPVSSTGVLSIRKSKLILTSTTIIKGYKGFYISLFSDPSRGLARTAGWVWVWTC